MRDIATKITRVKDVRIVCELPHHVGHTASALFSYGSPEYWKRYEADALKWVKDFEDFMRDHRSQDQVSLTVEKDEQECCSACGDIWHTDTDENGEFCCKCGAIVATGQVKSESIKP